MHQVSLAHVSDTHLGFVQYPHKTFGSIPVRTLDMETAFTKVVSDIESWDPPLVIHSGDFYDQPRVPNRVQKVGQDLLVRLSRRPGPYRRLVVVLTGNHDQPRSLVEPAALELNGYLPAVVVVSQGYEVIRLTEQFVTDHNLDPVLVGLAVHVLPHDSLRDPDILASVVPVSGMVNVLTTHGVVGGSDQWRRSLGREYALPTSVAAQEWEYVALGHWHTRTPVPVPTLPGRLFAWYAGSPEYNGFADVPAAPDPNSSGRGYLRVTLNPGADPSVSGVDVAVRPAFRTDPVFAAGLDTAALAEAISDVLPDPASAAGAMVQVPVMDPDPHVWALLDRSFVASRLPQALHVEVKRKSSPSTRSGSTSVPVSQVPESAAVSDVVPLLHAAADRLLPARWASESAKVAADLLAAVESSRVSEPVK